jgi:hypothetical protein
VTKPEFVMVEIVPAPSGRFADGVRVQITTPAIRLPGTALPFHIVHDFLPEEVTSQIGEGPAEPVAQLGPRGWARLRFLEDADATGAP